MGQTSNPTLRYPDGNQRPSVAVHLKNLADDTKAAINYLENTLTSDTGWVNVTLLSGYTGSAYVRRHGEVIEIRGTVSGSFPNGVTNFGTIPGSFVPGGNNARIAAWLSGHQTGTAFVDTGGGVGVTHQTGTRTQVQFRGTWLRG